MKSENRCLKCNSDSCIIKTTTIPTKTSNRAKIIGLDTFYLKICLDCGFTEMYSAKVVEKVRDPVKDY